MTTTLLAGMGKADITVYEHGMCMFGWGQPNNVATEVAVPLYARALIVRSTQTQQQLAYVCADLGFISQRLRQRVIALSTERNLGFGEHEIMLTATHTHSAPNGYSDYLFYGVTGPGFSEPVLNGLALGIVKAMENALAQLGPATLRLSQGSVPLTEAVAFNRSLEAYNLNADVEPIRPGRSDEAVDRTMTMLRVDRVGGGPCGFLCWFPTHGTSIHHENTRIHSDNKGLAARRCEQRGDALSARPDSFVAIFAQEAAGDVTPNFRWSAERRVLIGRCDDDFESADFAGEIQARNAWSLFVDAETRGAELDATLDAKVRYRDFSALTVDPEFANGREGQSTTTACLGLGFAYGTLEGPGPGFVARNYNGLFSRAVAWRRKRRTSADWRTMHGPKARFFDLGRGATGNIMTLLPMQPPGFRYIPDRRVAYYSAVLDAGLMGNRPWVPQVLPIQVMRIGALSIVGMPVEPTTVSGRRVRAAVLSVLAGQGVKHAVINGYANAYASYVATFEEYQLQHYEGASTLFGQWTLGAFCTELRALARDMITGAADTLTLLPPQFERAQWLPSEAATKGKARHELTA